MEGLGDEFAAAPEQQAPVAVEANGGSGEIPAAAAPLSEDMFAAPVAAPAEGDSFFTDGWNSAPAEQTPAPAPVFTEEDPRLAWNRKNQEVLDKKEKAEKEAKSKFGTAAKDHLKKFYEVRDKSLKDKQKGNRADQKQLPEAGVPTKGTTWEKVHAMVNYASGLHQKDLGRFKATLEARKAIAA